MRRSTDQLTFRRLTPREREAVTIIESRPGITIAEVRDTLGVGPKRIWQIIDRLEAGRVRRQGDPRMRLVSKRYKPHEAR